MLNRRLFLVWCVVLLGYVHLDAQGVDPVSLKQNVKWAIFHEGCRVYTIQNAGQDPAYQQMANIGWLRGCYMDVQSHNQRAQDEIRNANDDLLTTATLQAASEVPGEFQLDGALEWVAYHEGQMVQFRALNAKADEHILRQAEPQPERRESALRRDEPVHPKLDQHPLTSSHQSETRKAAREGLSQNSHS